MKGFIEFIAMFSLGRVIDVLRAIIKNHCLRLYVNLVDSVRSIYFTLIIAIASLLLLLTGFIMLHAALFLFLPWTMSSKIILLLILGSIYFLGPLVLLIFLQSRGRWLKISGVKKIVDDVCDKK
jgi:hypothetical protein